MFRDRRADPPSRCSRVHFPIWRLAVDQRSRQFRCIRPDVAMLGLSTAAWRLNPGDPFIGWKPEIREKNLPLDTCARHMGYDLD